MTNKNHFLLHTSKESRYRHCYRDHVSIYCIPISIIANSRFRCTTIAHCIFIFHRLHFSIYFIAMSYCCAVAVINVCMLRLRRNKQNMKKERNRVAFSRSRDVYNSSSAKDLQQHPEAGPSFLESTGIVNYFTGRQIDAGKSCCTTFFVRYIAT